MALVWNGVMPLTLENARFIPEEDRLCRLSELGETESETHFVLYCLRCDDFRNLLFGELFV